MKTQETPKIEAILHEQRDRHSISGRITGAILYETVRAIAKIDRFRARGDRSSSLDTHSANRTHLKISENLPHRYIDWRIMKKFSSNPPVLRDLPKQSAYPPVLGWI